MFHIKIFVDQSSGDVLYILHDTDHVGDDKPGKETKLKRNSKLRFKTGDGDLMIHFPGDWPFTEPQTDLTALSGEFTSARTIKRAPLGSVNPAFKYEVTIAGELVDDPEIIIDTDSGTGGGKKKSKGKPKKK